MYASSLTAYGLLSRRVAIKRGNPSATHCCSVSGTSFTKQTPTINPRSNAFCASSSRFLCSIEIIFSLPSLIVSSNHLSLLRFFKQRLHVTLLQLFSTLTEYKTHLCIRQIGQPPFSIALCITRIYFLCFFLSLILNAL